MSIILFLKVSGREAESWSMAEIYPVFVIGLCLEIPPALLMCFFSDKHVVKDEEDDDNGATVPQTQQDVRSDLEVPLLSGNDTSGENVTSPSSLGKSAIPYCLFISSLWCRWVVVRV